MVHKINFAIFKDSNPARTQVRIPLGTMISIARDYENNLTAIQIGGMLLTISNLVRAINTLFWVGVLDCGRLYFKSGKNGLNVSNPLNVLGFYHGGSTHTPKCVEFWNNGCLPQTATKFKVKSLLLFFQVIYGLQNFRKLSFLSPLILNIRFFLRMSLSIFLVSIGIEALSKKWNSDKHFGINLYWHIVSNYSRDPNNFHCIFCW